CWQRPPSSTQVSSVQSLLSEHALALPVQEPPLHASRTVQNRPSSQGLVLLTLWHASSSSLQVSLVQSLLSVQTRCHPRQVPSVHASFTVQYRPSSHGLLLFAWSQASASSLHESSVQSLLSLQSRGVPTQAPPEQVPSMVQKTPASQGSVLFVWPQESVSSL